MIYQNYRGFSKIDDTSRKQIKRIGFRPFRDGRHVMITVNILD